MRLSASTFAIVAFLVAAASVAKAATGSWDSNDHVSMRVISAVEGVGGRPSLPMGLQFRMKPGWKIYWRSPGDAGYPPKADWSGSENVADVAIRWPAPHRFSIFGLETLGYENEVILPLTVGLQDPGKPATLVAAVDYLTCKDICIPYRATSMLSLPEGPASPGPMAFELDRYVQRVPGPGASHGLTVENVVLAPSEGGVTLRLEAAAIDPFVSPDVYVEGPEGTHFGKPAVDIADRSHTATLALRGGGFDDQPAGREFPLTLTLVDGDRMMEKTVLARLGSPDGGAAGPALRQAEAGDAEPHSLLTILFLALLGGLILNLMPCVLPVLSLKLLSVVGHGGGDTLHVRAGFIASAAGILFSFAVLAGLLVGLQAGGIAIGWGIQFQQPLFLAAMTVVVTLFACNLFGLFEISLPGRIADLAGTAGGSHSLIGHFVMGAFATLLATPCTAPFLGTAVGFALSRGPAEIFGIFLVLGLGLALPYLSIALFPALATALPRPGPWMLWLRRILGLALIATAAWLVSVVAVQIGRDGAISIGLMMALLIAVFAARRLPGSRLGQHAGKAAIILSVAAIAVAAIEKPEGAGPAEPATSSVWHPFDEAEIRRAVQSGRTVFVDVTADWCLTCKVNKKLVLDRPPVADWLAGPDVVAMRADWTRPDPAISTYLATFGRYGIPFNAIYGPNAPKGVALPELLTADSVAAAAGRAGSARGLANQ